LLVRQFAKHPKGEFCASHSCQGSARALSVLIFSRAKGLGIADLFFVRSLFRLHSQPAAAKVFRTFFSSPAEDSPMSKSFQDWLREGENLYDGAMSEYQAIEAQLEDLERQLTEKKSEVNQIAEIIGKPPVESNRRLTAQIIEGNGSNTGNTQNPSSAAAIARAITGRSLGR
jgi:hypothetical protein